MTPNLQLTIDCAGPVRMVDFWCLALGYEPESPPGGHASWREFWLATGLPPEELPEGAGESPESIVDPAGRGPRVWFQQVPEAKTVKNRIHLDLNVGGGRSVPLATRTERVDAAVRRLTEAGATVLRNLGEPAMDYYGVVLADPESNEFCVV
ncbi:VOC family protein [Streptomyces sp. AJS327]|uniref:VOC family protein n=1 Tax=Streptomyces sp. AJS327 TaxID=2545265 RepID=UPI0015E01EBF|nr:VOC family protein [Streptomyces sp. AJS327]MBA0050411.1 VOC family protein [Streptomyces sp. AJS327]